MSVVKSHASCARNVKAARGRLAGYAQLDTSNLRHTGLVVQTYHRLSVFNEGSQDSVPHERQFAFESGLCTLHMYMSTSDWGHAKALQRLPARELSNKNSLQG